MTELKQLRDFAEEVNGVRPTERSLKGVVNNLINNYKGGSGGTGTGYGSDYCIFNMDFYDLVNGKHLDVNNLISLFDKYEMPLDTPISTNIDIDILPSPVIPGDNSDYFIRVGYNDCSGGFHIYIGYNEITLTESAETFRELLLANKTVIEESIIDYSFASGNSNFYEFLIDYGAGSSPQIKFSELMQCIKQ